NTEILTPPCGGAATVTIATATSRQQYRRSDRGSETQSIYFHFLLSYLLNISNYLCQMTYLIYAGHYPLGGAKPAFHRIAVAVKTASSAGSRTSQ
ncbi:MULTISPECIES: hypothetical protein, partial [Burkholderia]|uniref:hypothetical protein n=1 Tax=Burkholderia TaxID=32008 RepID=UPI001969D3FD